MQNRLNASLIIPNHLYVEREADRNLEEAIQRMSKPAYISVARQMGKTNLLIHVKQKLENKNNNFVFIDVTNHFTSSQDCFRYIIDQIIDSNERIDEFSKAGAEIRAKRLVTSNENSTKEYQDELRTILKRYRGNLVIFLDEVDSLHKHTFSDEIFAQIRKGYFVRVSYPEFNRLSYVLSGVIDPERLIKNQINSPFNIAVPIHLNDFTFNEFAVLVEKSGVILPKETVVYIYEWLKGNPRMSVDVLSHIIDMDQQRKEITSNVIDDVINSLYLSNFKQPPVDHIVSLVKNNSEIRKAVSKLKQGRINELSNDIKNKLYLSGIISSRTNNDTVSIKNRVINLSLSSDLLNQVDFEKAGYGIIESTSASEEVYERSEYVNELYERVAAVLDRSQRDVEQQGKWLLASMLDWYRREKKATWWEYFRLSKLSDDELIHEKSAISGLKFTG
jgi:hypothetical protein